jgi:hypothetical protein
MLCEAAKETSAEKMMKRMMSLSDMMESLIEEQIFSSYLDMEMFWAKPVPYVHVLCVSWNIEVFTQSHILCWSTNSLVPFKERGAASNTDLMR